MAKTNKEKWKEAVSKVLDRFHQAYVINLNKQTLEDIKKWDDDNVQPDHIVEGIHNERGLVNKTSL
jgi:hypothetical protein